MDAIYADCVSQLGSNSNPMSAFQKATIQVVGERDFGAQETAHIWMHICSIIHGKCTGVIISEYVRMACGRPEHCTF